jgi:hypothetical protein
MSGPASVRRVGTVYTSGDNDSLVLMRPRGGILVSTTPLATICKRICGVSSVIMWEGLA